MSRKKLSLLPSGICAETPSNELLNLSRDHDDLITLRSGDALFRTRRVPLFPQTRQLKIVSVYFKLNV